MYDVRKSSINGHIPAHHEPRAEASQSQTNSWLFTDPAARTYYAQQGRLDALQGDIQDYVLWGGQWAGEELELYQALRHLRQAGVLVEKGTVSYLSPHPSVLRAGTAGTLTVAGRKQHFEPGDDVVFSPWLARAHSPGRIGPVWIGRLRTTSRLCLNTEAFPRTSQLCECALHLLRQTLGTY